MEEYTENSNRFREFAIQHINSIAILVAIILIMEIGAAFMYISIYAKKDPTSLAEWFGEAGRTIIVTGLIAFIYEYLVKKGIYRELTVDTKDIHNKLLAETKGKIAEINEDYRNLNESTKCTCENICNDYEKILKETKDHISTINSDLVSACDAGRSFKKHLENTEDTMKFSKSVMESGLVKVHPSRRSALNSLSKNINQIKDQAEVNIYLCGITLQDFFDDNGNYYEDFKSWLQNIGKLKVYVIMLKNGSKTAQERARRENPRTYSQMKYTGTRLSSELKNTENNIENLRRSYPDKITMKKSSACPLCFLAVINDAMVMEPYNYAVRGGVAPVLEIKRSNIGNKSDLYDIYMQHFISLWIKPCQGYESEMMEDLSRFIELKPKSYEEYLVNKDQRLCQEDESEMMEELSHIVDVKPKSYEEYLGNKEQNNNL